MQENFVNLITLKCDETIMKMRTINGKCAQNIVYKFWKYDENSWKSSNFESVPKIFEKIDHQFWKFYNFEVPKNFWKFSNKFIFSKNYECAQNWKFKKIDNFSKNLENFLFENVPKKLENVSKKFC
jgi:hypothetical protein